MIDSFKHSIHLDIENCTFSNNQTIVGGGMIVLVKLEDHKSFTDSIHFLHSQHRFSLFGFQRSLYWPDFHTSAHRYLYTVFFGNTAITDGCLI